MLNNGIGLQEQRVVAAAAKRKRQQIIYADYCKEITTSQKITVGIDVVWRRASSGAIFSRRSETYYAFRKFYLFGVFFARAKVTI